MADVTALKKSLGTAAVDRFVQDGMIRPLQAPGSGRADRHGRRPMLLSGLALFLLGSIVSAIAGTPGALLLGRLVQAIGAGCALTLVRAIARDAYQPDQLVKAITIWPLTALIIAPTGPIFAIYSAIRTKSSA